VVSVPFRLALPADEKGTAMVKARIPLTIKPAPTVNSQRRATPKPNGDVSLLLVRLRELDREFARQTKQLTALTKKLGKKLTGINPD
jgi:hypothetical protein